MNLPPWRITLFGGLTVQNERHTLATRSQRRSGALLACLVLRSPHAVPREELLELLWNEEPPDITRNRFRVLLSGLRQHLEPEGKSVLPLLRVERRDIALDTAAFSSDYHDFLRALHTAKTAQDETQALASLETALTLYQGELLPGFYDEWILTERRHLAERHAQALRDFVRRCLNAGVPERALDAARQSVMREPLDEEANADLMRLYMQTGQPSAALRQYEQLKRLLREEVHAQPSASLRQFGAKIEAAIGHGSAKTRRVVRPVLPRAEDQTVTRAPVGNLPPASLTRFFGREQEIADLSTLLAPESTARLTSLLGPGGAGKTRLALETARRLAEAYAGRVYFVPLADLTDPELIGVRLAKALHLPIAPGVNPLSQVVEVLSQTPTLLVLDNLEQLLPQAAPVIERLLSEGTSLHCLVTSRRSIRIEGEQEILLRPLSLPEPEERREALPDYSGIALFVDRMRLVRPDFTLTDGNAADVVRFCRALEGLPLALELAAARARIMTPAEMQRQTGHLLSWLTDGSGSKPARHRSLRAAIAWSYRLLTAEEHTFFRVLSVFTGGFSAQAAAFVGQAALVETLALLEQLQAASLLTGNETEDGTTRFVLLEPLREFGGELLAESGEEETLRRRHLTYFASDFLHAKGSLSSQNAEAKSSFVMEEGNLREAVAFGLRPEASLEENRQALTLIQHLTGYWEAQGRWQEGLTAVRRALQRADSVGRSEQKVALCQDAAHFADLLGEHTAARSFAEEGLTYARQFMDDSGRAGCLSVLGSVAFHQDDYAQARERFTEALSLYERTGNAQDIAACLVYLGNLAFFTGDHTEARTRLEEALRLYRAQDDLPGAAAALLRLGNVRRDQGYGAEARIFLREALTLFQKLGNRQGVASSLNGLGLAAYLLGDYAEAKHCYLDSLAMVRQIGFRRGIVSTLHHLGNLLQETGETAEAAQRHQEAIEICRKISDRRTLAACLCSLGWLSLTGQNPPEATAHFTEALAIEEEIASPAGRANCLKGLGYVALEQNRFTEAQTCFAKALRLYQMMGLRVAVATMLEACALLAYCRTEFRRAAHLAGAAASLRQRIRFSGHRLPAQKLDGLRTELAVAAPHAWEEGEQLSEEHAVVEALQTLEP